MPTLDPLDAVEPLTAALFALAGAWLLGVELPAARRRDEAAAARLARAVGWAWLAVAAAMGAALALGLIPWSRAG